jgi:small ligand-binding sensory domain FIST
MKPRAGVGFSDASDSRTAARAAATEAMRRADVAACDLVLLFATSRHDPVALRDGVREIVGADARLVGGSAGGVITNDRLGYEGFEVGVAVIASSDLRIDLFQADGLDRGERAAGEMLGRQIAATAFASEPSLLVLYDSARRLAHGGPPVLNMATPLIEGIAAALDPMPPVAGAGLLGDGMFQLPIAQWCDDTIRSQSAITLALSGNVRMETLVLHGCRPASGYHTITGSDGPVVSEIDGRPALAVIEELVGPGLDVAQFPLFVTLGINRGEKFGEVREELYVNRLCFSVDPEQGALIMFEPDLAIGAEVQLMRRSIGFDYIEQRVAAMLAGLEGREPFFALYIDCLGRCGAYSNSALEEAVEVQRQIGDIPMLGFYSGVEIASVGDRLQALDWTGVLCVFTSSDE